MASARSGPILPPGSGRVHHKYTSHCIGSWIMAGWTTVAIAHRLSTLRRAPEVLVTDQGRIVERGTHSGHWRLKGTTPASTGGSFGLIVTMLE